MKKTKNGGVTAPIPKKKVPLRSYLRNTWQLYLMMLLPILYIICFKYKPMLGIVIAFKKYNMFAGVWDSPWVGLDNFKAAFSTSAFWDSVRNTLILNLGDLIIGFPVPVILAIFLNELRSNKIRKASQLILYLPNFLSWVIIAGIVQQLLSGSGLVNNLITKLGGESIPFLSNGILWTIVYWVFGIWQSAGYSLIIFLAALMSADPSLNEAAYIDGATRMKRIWHVTIPQIMPTISTLMIMQMGKIINIGFDRPYTMGNALVKSNSQVISTYVYETGLGGGRFDYAAAVGLFQSVIGIVMIVGVNAISKKMGQEGIM